MFHLTKLAFLSLMSLICLLHLRLIFNRQHVCLLVSSKHVKDFFRFLLPVTSSVPRSLLKIKFSGRAHERGQVKSTEVNGERCWWGGKKSDKYLFSPPGGKSSNILFLNRSTIIWNIWMHGCSEQGVFFFLLLLLLFFSPSDGPYSSPPLCSAQLAGLSVVTTSPFNAPDRGLFAPIYVFSPITPWQAAGCQATTLRCWWSPLWLVLPASSTIFFIFLDSIREDSLIYLSLVQSVV